jgi:hypothetical protein
MNTRHLKVLLLTLVLAAGALVFAQPTQASVRVGCGIFPTTPWRPYGRGRRIPTTAGCGSRRPLLSAGGPYTDGQWAYANEYGWTWASADPWGWATDHYGRWL